MRVLAVVVGVVAVATAVLLGLEAVVVVLFGWPFFLARVLPGVSPDGPTVVVGVTAVVLLAAGTHLCGRRWVPGWRARWAGMAVAAVGLLFGVGVAVIGIAHQVAWLATADRPAAGRRLARVSSASENNLKQIGMGWQNYQDGERPPPGPAFAPAGRDRHGWVTPLLPYLGYSAPGLDLTRPWDDPANRLYYKCVLPVLISPDARTPPVEDGEGYGLAHYAANARVMGPGATVTADALAGGRSTIALVGEVGDGFRPWGHPRNVRDPAAGTGGGANGFGGLRGGGALFLMADGSVRRVGPAADPAVLEALAGPRRPHHEEER